jgi:hypothetical protein
MPPSEFDSPQGHHQEKRGAGTWIDKDEFDSHVQIEAREVAPRFAAPRFDS